MNDIIVRGELCSFRKKIFNNITSDKRWVLLAIIERFLHSPRAISVPIVEMTRGGKRSRLKSLVSYVLYLATIKILFCVCLAHAGQRGVGNPAAAGVAFQSRYSLTGKVLSAGDNTPLEGATVSIQGRQIKVLTNKEGAFRIIATDSIGVLSISYIGYQTTEIHFNRRETGPFTVQLESNGHQLEEVEVSTGYQTLPKERATGSFVQIDNELLNRSVSTDVISRLKGIAPSLSFDERAGGEPKLSIRGRSTIFANDQPLIVVDNFPYEGDINNINPNDIENISILRDAAAASIWGVRAANGVIVIITKKGNAETLQISLNTNATIGNRPNLFYQPQMSAAEFIGLERMLFDKGFYNNDINNVISYPPLSPAVELLEKAKQGAISSEDLNEQLVQLGAFDIRNDLSNYFYQKSLKQQYALNIRGGSSKYNYYFGSGYDHNREHMVGNASQRLSLTTRQMVSPFKDFQLTIGLDYIRATNQSNNTLNDLRLGNRNIYPYARLADEAGNALQINNKYRTDFLNDSFERGLLDWTYTPLDEIDRTMRTGENNSVRLQTGMTYKIWKGLHAEIRYQYQQQQDNRENLYHEDAFYTRDLVNRYSAFQNGALIRNIPAGAILNRYQNGLHAHNGRGQLNYNGTWEKHAVAAIAGFEVREMKTSGNSAGFYGYDVANGTSMPVNYNTYYNLYPSGYALINEQRSVSGTVDRFRSYYSNISYTYDAKYTVSASGRIDQSNLFGVDANLKAVPLWSIGTKWALSSEDFYKVDWLPSLQLKATYGYNGNLDNTVTAYTTARLLNSSFTGRPAATIISPPNPNLQWERVSMLNLGVDFGSRNERVTGSFEYYSKKATDLIGEGPLGATTGLTKFRGNVADMIGKGWDLQVASNNLTGKFKWMSNIMLSSVIDEITDYKLNPNSLNSYFPDRSILRETSTYTPTEGRPLFSVYSYRFAGLDGTNGNPLGFLNGMPSDNYSAMASMSNTTVDSLIYHGRAQAPFFGALRNTFTYRQWSVSINVSFSFGHYFRKPTINYADLFTYYSSLHTDFNLRWRQPGDEQHTTVPSLVYPNITGRDAFYMNSEVNVRRADLVRLQDINLSYALPIGKGKSAVKLIRLYAYANNLGLLWTANKDGIDPDFLNMPLPFTLSLGAKLEI